MADPVSGLALSDGSAWRLIAKYAEEGHEITAIPLKKPAGAKGYVMNILLEPGRELYVKVELHSGRIWGRSFHYSDVRGE